MSTLRNVCFTECDDKTIVDDLVALEVGQDLEIEEDTSFRISGQIYDCPSFDDGTTIVTSYITAIHRESEDCFVAYTDKGKEYAFDFKRRYGLPTINSWRTVDEADSVFVDFAIKNQTLMDLEGETVDIMGEACDIPDCKDGDSIRIRNVVGFAPVENAKECVCAITKNGSKYLLPILERVGFINANGITNWHMVFSAYPETEAGIKELRDFLKEFRMFSTARVRLGSNMFYRQVLEVPRTYELSLENDKISTGQVERFIKITYRNTTRLYAAANELSGEVLEFSPYTADDVQKMIMDAVYGKEIKKTKTNRLVSLLIQSNV
jgi:hypothetical protein